VGWRSAGVGRSSGQTIFLAFRTRDSYIAFDLESIAGPPLVELWKGLVVFPYLTISVEVYENHDLMEDGYHGLWVNMCNLCTV
jgi:hypothetical protein